MRLVVCLFIGGCAGRAGSEPSRQGLTAGVDCPSGTRYQAGACRGLVVVDCPAGTQFEDGVGCVARMSQGPGSGAESPLAPDNPCLCTVEDIACQMLCQYSLPIDELGMEAMLRDPSPIPLGVMFDRQATSEALAHAKKNAKGCAMSGHFGACTVRLRFLPNGQPDHVEVSAPFDGTEVGECIRSTFGLVTVPRFVGPPASVSTSLTL